MSIVRSAGKVKYSPFTKKTALKKPRAKK